MTESHFTLDEDLLMFEWLSGHPLFGRPKLLVLFKTTIFGEDATFIASILSFVEWTENPRA